MFIFIIFIFFRLDQHVQLRKQKELGLLPLTARLDELFYNHRSDPVTDKLQKRVVRFK